MTISPFHSHSVRNFKSRGWRDMEKFSDKFEDMNPEIIWSEDFSSDLWEKFQEDTLLKQDPETKPIMVSAAELDTMTYLQTEALIRKFDDWIFQNMSDMNVLDEGVKNIQILENHQFTLLKNGDKSSSRGAKSGDKVVYGDLWADMAGLPFVTLDDAGKIPKGTKVTMVYYSRMNKNVIIKHKKGFRTFYEKIDKTKIDIDPELGKTEGVIHYSVGSHDKDTRSSSDNVHEAAYNMHDPQIKHWVDFYNKKYHLKKKNPGDPNVLKSMLYQESKFGISGPALKLPPYANETTNGIQPDYVASRFNIGQTLDSWAQQQYMMMEEMAPEILKEYGLDQIASSYLKMGKDLITWNPEGEKGPPYAISKALDEFNSTKKRGFNLNAKKSHKNSGQNLFEDPDYMIRTAAKWWFHFYLGTVTPENPNGDWTLATKAYNGSGPSARIYMKQVYDRVDNLEEHPELAKGELNIDEKQLNAFRAKLKAEEQYVYNAKGVVQFMDVAMKKKTDNPDDVDGLENLILATKEMYPEEFHPYIDCVLNGSIETITQRKEELIGKAEQYVIDHNLNSIPWHKSNAEK